MAVALRVSLQNTLAEALAAAREAGRDMRPAWRAIGQQCVTFTRNRFLSKRAPDGSTWKPSLKTTGSTLIASGLLLRSIAAQPPEDDAVEVGSNRIYAGVQQAGGVIRAKTSRGLRFRVGANGGWITKQEVTIPARPYLGTNDVEMEAYGAIALRHLGGPLGAV
jgi:phage gpG-like protein